MPITRRNQALVEPIRDASRRMVRELGFMQSTMAGTRFSPSAVHAILEIGRHRRLTASQLSAMLRLEKSSVSRMVRKLVQGGQVVETADADDSRIKQLSLTANGRKTRTQIDRYAKGQVSTALGGLSEPSARAILDGLRTYADQLGKKRGTPGAAAPADIRIVTGYQPGIVGRMVEMQARYYAANPGFDQAFESRRASDIGEFASRLNRSRNQLWSAVESGRVVGTIVIDGDHFAPAAHLRWFMVDESMQGHGIGRRLMLEALAFCEAKKFPEIELDTFGGLDAARHLYEAFGFALVKEKPVSRWGVKFVEQFFVKRLR